MTNILVVLGAGYLPTGELGRVGKRRVEQAVEFLRQNRFDHIIFSGKRPDSYGINSDYDNSLTEAERMKNYAIDLCREEPQLVQKIERTAILETKSRFTDENISFVRPILEQLNATRVTILTSDTHQNRALLLARKMGWRGKIESVGVNTQDILEPEKWEKIREAEMAKCAEIRKSLKPKPIKTGAKPRRTIRRAATHPIRQPTGKKKRAMPVRGVGNPQGIIPKPNKRLYPK